MYLFEANVDFGVALDHTRVTAAEDIALDPGTAEDIHLGPDDVTELALTILQLRMMVMMKAMTRRGKLGTRDFRKQWRSRYEQKR